MNSRYSLNLLDPVHASGLQSQLTPFKKKNLLSSLSIWDDQQGDFGFQAHAPCIATLEKRR